MQAIYKIKIGADGQSCVGLITYRKTTAEKLINKIKTSLKRDGHPFKTYIKGDYHIITTDRAVSNG